MLDEKDVASLSLVDAVVHHASLAQRPSQTKVESTGGQQTSSDGERAGEGDTAAGEVKREYTSTVMLSVVVVDWKLNLQPIGTPVLDCTL